MSEIMPRAAERAAHVLGVLAFAASVGCGSMSAEPAPSPGRADSSAAVPPASAPPSESPSASAPPASSSAPTAAIDEPLTERRTFRHVLVGAVRYPPKRFTWVLSRGEKVARLQVSCQVGKTTSALGPSLTGKENDEALWREPVVTEYAGTGAGGGSYRLSTAPGPAGETGCETLPSVLRLQCRPEQVSVLPAGAALIPGRKLANDRMTPARWQPSTRERVTALRCDISLEVDSAPWLVQQMSREWPLMLAPGKRGSPGIEWAHENSDMVVQEGAYRWMPAPP